MNTRAVSAALLVSLLWASGAGGRGSPKTWVEATATTPSCTLDVVLVTFKDATRRPSDLKLNYHLHDRPYGTNPGQSSKKRYQLKDFERLFTGGYGTVPAFSGSNQKVAGGNVTLPKVYGSVRAYFDSMSLDPRDRAAGKTSGKFRLHVRVINAGNGGYPRWIELSNTKAFYHEIDAKDDDDRMDGRMGKKGDAFWDDAYSAAWDSVRCWNPTPIPAAPDPPTCGPSVPGYAVKDLPGPAYSKDRRIRHKVVYLYSGRGYAAKTQRKNNNGKPGLLHPQVDEITKHDPSKPEDVGYRYVMAERWGSGNDGKSDRFAAIGIHVHEIGHLLGLNHGGGTWNGNNPHTGKALLDTAGANVLKWGIMDGGASGPQVGSDGYHRGYGSCPVPVNPFYRMDLGWLKPVEIAASTQDHALALGSVHLIDVGTRIHSTGPNVKRDTLLLERRSHRGFGRYISYHEFADQDPGLLIWRRHRLTERPLLVTADGRRIRDAREKEKAPTVPEYQDQLSDPFPVPAGLHKGTYPGQPAVASVYAHTDTIGLRQYTRSLFSNPDPGNLGVALTDIRRDAEAGALTLDVWLNYWAESIVKIHRTVAPTREVWGDGIMGVVVSRESAPHNQSQGYRQTPKLACYSFTRSRAPVGD